jgi:hypothetical protein
VFRTFEPFIESNNVRMIESFEKIHFFIDHMFVTFHILFRDNFDSDRAIGSFRLLDYSIPILR